MRSIQFMIYGSSNFGHSGYVNMKNKEDIASFDLTGKTIMVTGGNSGLGFDACKMLARTHANILLVARSEERGAKAVEEIGAPNVKLMLCDVSRQDSVQQLIGKVDALDVLILNAGTLFPDVYEEVDGIERTLATNVVNNVQLIDGLLPVLKKSDDPRVILVSSGGGLTESLCKNKEEYNAGKFSGMTAYARTKRMQMALAKYYARHEPSVFFCSMHPGWSETPGVKTSIPGFYDTMKSKFRTSEEGADTMVWLAGTKAIDKATQNGALFRDRDVELEHFKSLFGGTQYSDDDQEAMYAFLKSQIREPKI